MKSRSDFSPAIQKFFFVLIVSFFTGCVSVRNTPLVQAPAEPVEIYVANRPQRPFSEMQYVEASASIFHSHRKLLKSIRRSAARSGADALVDVRFSYAGWIPVVSGVAVKYN